MGLTGGLQTTIKFRYNDKVYLLDVVDTLNPKDEPVAAIRVQVGDLHKVDMGV